ncbi:hypothetical protein L6R52_11735 [Myxococcota bacterium]|nr:hypothetical protein [Myxococcota bacterium]
MTLPLGDGEVQAFDGWYHLSETDLAKDAPPLAARMSAKASVAPPHLHLSLLPRPVKPAGEHLDALVTQLVENIPRVKIVERGETPFDDGTKGLHALIALELTPGRRTLMLHVVRDDLHLLGASAEQDKAKLTGELAAVLRSFHRP